MRDEMNRKPDTIPQTITPTELRKNIYAVVHAVALKGERYLVVPNEGDSVVICSRKEYNALISERQLLRDLRDGERDIKAGRTYSTSEVRRAVSTRRKRTSARRR